MTKEELAKAMAKIASRYIKEDVDSEIVKGNIVLYIYQVDYTFFYNEQDKLYKVGYSYWENTLYWVKQVNHIVDENGNIDFKKGDLQLTSAIYMGAYFTLSNLSSGVSEIEELSNAFKNSKYSEWLKEHCKLLDTYAKKLLALKENKQLIELSEKIIREYEWYRGWNK